MGIQSFDCPVRHNGMAVGYSVRAICFDKKLIIGHMYKNYLIKNKTVQATQVYFMMYELKYI